MEKKKLVMIHTVKWYDTVITKPFAMPWQKKHPEVEIINIMDDSLLTETLANSGPTKGVINRMLSYFKAAELIGADVIMSTCTSMGPATQKARKKTTIPIFNIDEPMAMEAVSKGERMGILATVPTSAPATRRLLEAQAEAAGKKISIKTVINEAAFQYRLQGDINKHDELVHAELEKLQHQVDVIVLGQISLAQVRYKTKVPMLQVGNSGFAHVTELLNRTQS